jgi:hypothetical protein
MKKSVGIAIFLLLLFCGSVFAEDYLIIEGGVSKIDGTSLLIIDLHDTQQKEQFYPISPFAQVFEKSGRPSSLANIANIGYVSKAKIYVLKGKVEKIVVEDLFQ